MNTRLSNTQNKAAFIGVIAGQGKNKNTWDSAHSKSSAYRIRKQLQTKYPESVFKVESLH